MFTDEIIKRHIQDAISECPEYVINGNEFRLQKGQEAWKAWDSLVIEDSLMKKLLSYNYSRNFYEFNNEASNNPVVADIKEKIFRLVAYFDVYASNKKFYNEYPDYRVVAGCQIRQNIFIQHLLKYKAGVESVLFSVKCLIAYITDPENNFAMVSEKDMACISECYLGKKYNKSSFIKELKEKFDTLCPIRCKNIKNQTFLYTRAMYIHKNDWRPEDKKFSLPMKHSKPVSVPQKSVDMAWFVGVMTSEGDHFDEWVKERVWQHKFSESDNPAIYEQVKSMTVGDRIVVKAACTKKNGLPFNINGGVVSVNKIKAYGTIIENPGDGQRVKVHWEKVFSPFKEWYFYTSFPTLWKLVRKESDWMTGALLDFVFNDVPQDYSRFLAHPYWMEKYSIGGESSDGIDDEPVIIDSYSDADFLADVYMEEESFNRLKELLLYKKNIILQGPCGVGKTYAAKRLAYSIIQKKDDSKIEYVQFHQNYSYEDFVQGYRPCDDGFVLTDGIFYNFCKKAEADSDNKYFFIIDEINRGNLSKIFGELLMLLEKDYRGVNASVKLSYSKMPFSIPENVYCIGMMNTADRSLAIMDYALRRRFAFFNFIPAFDVKAFVEYRASKDNKKFDSLVNEIKKLNQVINEDESLGKGFMIGHSYFCTSEPITDSFLYNVVENELIPLLEEYWFDEESKVKEYSEILRGLI